MKNILEEYNLINVVGYEPDPIALKLGYACAECGGMRITPLYGEKVCTCNDEYEQTEEVKAWRRNREQAALTICAQISYEMGFVCEKCSYMNPLWGQTKETANTCNHCGYKNDPNPSQSKQRN